MLLKAVLVYSIIISSDCLLFDEVENATFWSFSKFDGKDTKIRKIFNQTATISVFLSNSQDSEHVTRCLSGIFQNNTKTLIVNNLWSVGSFKKSNESVKSTEDYSRNQNYYGFLIFSSLDKLNESMMLHTNPVGSFLLPNFLQCS